MRGGGASVCVKEGRRVTCCSEGGRGGTCPVIQKAEVELDHVPSQLGIGGGGLSSPIITQQVSEKWCHISWHLQKQARETYGTGLPMGSSRRKVSGEVEVKRARGI